MWVRALCFAWVLLALPIAPRAGSAAALPRPVQDPPLQQAAGPFVVRHWPGHEPLANWLLAAAPGLAQLPALPPDVLYHGEPIQIILAPDAASFQRLAGTVPEWGAGVAIPSASTIVLPVFGRHGRDVWAMASVLRHELAHLALHRYLSPARPPRWFDEGFARWAAGEWDWEAGLQLRLAFAMQRAPPLDSLSLAWPAGAVDARIAYLLATTTVTHLVSRSGQRGLELFLQRWRDGDTMDAAMWRTYGMTLAQFEEHWRTDIRRRYGWTYFLSSTIVFWGFAGVLLLLLFARRRRRDRERMNRLREHEPPDVPAYWLETDPLLDDADVDGHPDRPPGRTDPESGSAGHPDRPGSQP
jgi:hypothetical protein